MSPIAHVSDTARWVALYRAMESERPGALFRDPYARRLAGARGEAIVRTLKGASATAWAMIVRTAVLDEMILHAVERDGVGLVLNLAAGLDARPWRLALPPALRWVDVDFPAILDYKRETIGGAPAACAYEMAGVDLADVDARRAFLARVGADAPRTLVLSEGLLVYLSAADVGALAADLYATPSVVAWLTDLASPPLLARIQRAWGTAAARGNAPFRFAPAEGSDFFRPFGWREAEFRSAMEEAHRLRREMRGAWLWRALARFGPAARREEFRRMSAFLRLERA